MTRSHWGSTATAVVTTLLLAACSSAFRSAPRTSPEPATGSQSDSTVIAKARADSARYRYTQADVEFMSRMIGHHAQALVMAGWAATHGASSSIRTLAERIINGQQDEIASMQQWLRDRGKPVPEPDTSGTRMAHSHGQRHEHLMPGMLTQTQLKQLDEARGPEFDRLFLTFMIQHHRGAVSMVKDLFGSQGAAQEETVFKFASDVSVDQSTEIARMERMLESSEPSARSPETSPGVRP